MTRLKLTPTLLLFTYGTVAVNTASFKYNKLPDAATYTSSPHAAVLVNRRLENLPESLIAALDKRTLALASVADSGNTLSSVVQTTNRWNIGSRVLVAFYGGDTELHRAIEQTTKELTDSCNIYLDFGYNKATDSYRTWSPQDRNYKGYIRVSFDEVGDWSLVGEDSTDKTIGEESDSKGGHPHQRSLNLEHFDRPQRPDGWRRIVRHEFMHALGFHHEHQHPSAVCENEFRWEDDPSYIPTVDDDAVYISDRNNRRPGIYTYLGGAPNHWLKGKVDYNLRPLVSLKDKTGKLIKLDVSQTIDAASIMLYRFPQMFYQHDTGLCIPTNEGEDLSPGDINALKKLYPKKRAAIQLANLEQKEIFTRLQAQPQINLGIRAVYKDKLDVLNSRITAIQAIK